jgi:hypothetical protein
MNGEEVGGFDLDLDDNLTWVASFLKAAGLPGHAASVEDARKRLKASMLPGWRCNACGAFNGDMKERLSACRCCGLARIT